MKTNNTKSGAFKEGGAPITAVPISGTLGARKYSNYDSLSSWKGTGLNNGNSSLSSGSGVFDWVGLGNNLIDTVGSVATSIWGKGDKYLVQALEIINEQQRKTTIILWVVIGLMAALGVVLLIRKTK